jgi:hypothetical protein
MSLLLDGLIKVLKEGFEGDHLHASRVVISRLLKKIENEQLVKLNRNQITLL